MSEIDGYGHVNNAAYLDFAGQAVLDALEGAGWSFDRMLESGKIGFLAYPVQRHFSISLERVHVIFLPAFLRRLR